MISFNSVCSCNCRSQDHFYNYDTYHISYNQHSFFGNEPADPDPPGYSDFKAWSHKKAKITAATLAQEAIITLQSCIDDPVFVLLEKIQRDLQVMSRPELTETIVMEDLEYGNPRNDAIATSGIYELNMSGRISVMYNRVIS